MTALTALIKISIKYCSFRPFFVAVSKIEPFISHAEGLVDTLDDSNPEKSYFRAMVSLARAISVHYVRVPVDPNGVVHDIRYRLIKLLYAYRYVACPKTQENQLR